MFCFLSLQAHASNSRTANSLFKSQQLLSLEEIHCHHAAQFLAASLRKPQRFRSYCSSWFFKFGSLRCRKCELEITACRKCKFGLRCHGVMQIESTSRLAQPCGIGSVSCDDDYRNPRQVTGSSPLGRQLTATQSPMIRSDLKSIKTRSSGVSA